MKKRRRPMTKAQKRAFKKGMHYGYNKHKKLLRRHRKR